MKKIKGYKVFNPDMTCRYFQYEVGKEYIHNGEIVPCESGFHFCKKAVDCFNYYSFNSENKVCEVEGYGKTLEHEDKIVCSKIKIIKELSWSEVLEIVNTGKGNTGYCNSGDRNSGGWNSGDENSGDWNSGNRNSGYWNSCNKETGYFNSVSNNKIRIFNKECDIEVWENSEKPNFIYDIDLTKYEDEKLITYSYKEAWSNSWNKAKCKKDWEEEYNKLVNLPNFDKEVFKEITGIDVDLQK